eukprot:gnl/MRDRNA2_/MRDRNA2_70061_c0_seq2.p1 gnl/MRDRNA2_/MRDRNA2_70061_c0~~gnl/MRDRNA2_/MRDRNA2_70061_c0_seq2.p1  ORF type:complete len:276 (+),score=30.83 gnl/MRDRNA2_/MRDRNA2_70061_c0_seq2:60-887(+)
MHECKDKNGCSDSDLYLRGTRNLLRRALTVTGWSFTNDQVLLMKSTAISPACFSWLPSVGTWLGHCYDDTKESDEQRFVQQNGWSDASIVEESPVDQVPAVTLAPSPLHPQLPQVHYLHDLFPASFLERLEEEQWQHPAQKESYNMYCTRMFFNDAKLAAELLSYLPPWLGYTRICSQMRFLRYPPGGYIAPHTDGVRIDEDTLHETTTSFLLYLEDIPEGEGGETEFLTSVENGDVVASVLPKSGSILLFPHTVPHQGNGVGMHPKVLLRGDLY